MFVSEEGHQTRYGLGVGRGRGRGGVILKVGGMVDFW